MDYVQLITIDLQILSKEHLSLCLYIRKTKNHLHHINPFAAGFFSVRDVSIASGKIVSIAGYEKLLCLREKAAFSIADKPEDQSPLVFSIHSLLKMFQRVIGFKTWYYA